MQWEGPARAEPTKDFVKYHPDFETFLANLKVIDPATWSLWG